jgi:hypothetical protein
MVDDPVPSDPNQGFLDDIRLWLGLDESTFQALTNTVLITFCSLSLFVVFVVSSNRRRRGQHSDKAEFVNENWVDLDDDDSDEDIEITPIVSVDDVSEEHDEAQDLGAEESTDSPVSETVIENDNDESASTSNRSGRANRRERRAVEAEMKQVLADMHKSLEESGLPPLPAPGELPPLPAPGELPPLPAPGELPPLPAPGELPPLPAPGELPPLPAPGELPPLPAPGELPPLAVPDELPPLPNLPAPEIPVTCTACESTFTARANKARRVKCPLCGETVRL